MKATNLLLVFLALMVAPTMPLKAQFITTTNDDTITITGYSGSSAVVNIPDWTNGYRVTSIGNGAFYYCTNLTNVTIGTNITTIGVGAFFYCTGLSGVSIPNNVTSIGGGAFANCVRLANVRLPENITTISNCAFYSCGLTNVAIPNSVKSIGNCAFYGCSGLAKVTIPNSVTNIGEEAFQDCTALTSVTIPNSVTALGSAAFYYCGSLNHVFFQGDAPSCDFSVFGMDIYVTNYYLPGTTGWSNTFFGLPAVLWNPSITTADASFGIQTNRFGFTVTGTANIPLVVEGCPDPAGGTWTTLQSLDLVNGSVYFSDPQRTNYPAWFYRIRSP